MNQTQFLLLVLVALGGAGGSVLRYMVQGWLTRGDFPWGTLAVNVSGTFLLALTFFSFLAGGGLSAEARALLFFGVFGGYTTMSSFGLETISLLGDGRYLVASANVLLNVGLCLGGAILGRAVGLWIAGG